MCGIGIRVRVKPGRVDVDQDWCGKAELAVLVAQPRDDQDGLGILDS